VQGVVVWGSFVAVVEEEEEGSWVAEPVAVLVDVGPQYVQLVERVVVVVVVDDEGEVEVEEVVVVEAAAHWRTHVAALQPWPFLFAFA